MPSTQTTIATILLTLVLTPFPIQSEDNQHHVERTWQETLPCAKEWSSLVAQTTRRER